MSKTTTLPTAGEMIQEHKRLVTSFYEAVNLGESPNIFICFSGRKRYIISAFPEDDKSNEAFLGYVAAFMAVHKIKRYTFSAECWLKEVALHDEVTAQKIKKDGIERTENKQEILFLTAVNSQEKKVLRFKLDKGKLSDEQDLSNTAEYISGAIMEITDRLPKDISPEYEQCLRLLISVPPNNVFVYEGSEKDDKDN